MYTYRECISLGETNLSSFKVVQILRELSREWPGNSYDLLAKNCNHFCDVLCDRLEVSKLPGYHLDLIYFMHIQFKVYNKPLNIHVINPNPEP